MSSIARSHVEKTSNLVQIYIHYQCGHEIIANYSRTRAPPAEVPDQKQRSGSRRDGSAMLGLVAQLGDF